jgi:hypothetical protein
MSFKLISFKIAQNRFKSPFLTGCNSGNIWKIKKELFCSIQTVFCVRFNFQPYNLFFLS